MRQASAKSKRRDRGIRAENTKHGRRLPLCFEPLENRFVLSGLALGPGGPLINLDVEASASPALEYEYIKIADGNTPIPGGTGNFTRLGESSISGGNVFFVGAGEDREGIYRYSDGSLEVVVDTDTNVPGSTETFTSFFPMVANRGPSADGDAVAFVADSNGQSGVYLYAEDSLVTIADRSTLIPGETKPFIFFSSPGLSDGSIVFQGSNSSQEGIYHYRQGVLGVVADTDTAIPEGTGMFNRFFGASNSSDSVVFSYSQANNAGVYTFIDGSLGVLADLNSSVPGEDGTFGNFVGVPSIDEEAIAFLATGSELHGIVSNRTGDLAIVANRDTAAPGSSGNFSSFGAPSISGTNIAFMGFAVLNPTVGVQPGIYLDRDGAIQKVINLNDTLDGQRPLLISMGSGLSGNSVAFRASFQPAGTSTGSLYMARPKLTLDFGDAPASHDSTSRWYPTRLEDDGARHLLSNDIFMGAEIDAEPDGQPNENATGDDINGIADEDGVTGLDVDLIPGESAEIGITVMTPEVGYLNAWIDWNFDGDWSDSSEQVFTDVALTMGSHTLEFDVPEVEALGATFARFRLSSTPGLSPRGLAADGEVEDYEVAIGKPCLTGGPFSVGVNRLENSCVTPGGFAAFVMGTQPGSYFFEDYGVTVDIADPSVPALAVGNIDGVAEVLVNLTEQDLSRSLLVQSFEMLPIPQLSNLIVVPSRLDVNRDGVVSALDALNIINHMGHEAAFGSIEGGALLVSDIEEPYDFDANGDGTVSSRDALTVINRLHQLMSNKSELEPSARWISDPASSGFADEIEDELLRMLADDAVSQLGQPFA